MENELRLALEQIVQYIREPDVDDADYILGAVYDIASDALANHDNRLEEMAKHYQNQPKWDPTQTE